MKEEILDKFQFKFAVMLERSLYSEDELEKVYTFISQALEDYADWKIKECIGEKEVVSESDYLPEEKIIRNQFRDQILTNYEKLDHKKYLEIDKIIEWLEEHKGEELETECW